MEIKVTSMTPGDAQGDALPRTGKKTIAIHAVGGEGLFKDVEQLIASLKELGYTIDI